MIIAHPSVYGESIHDRIL